MELGEAVRLLKSHYGRPEPPPTSDPFELILLENVAYLASPEERREAFSLLKKSIGTDPAKLLAAKPAALESVTARGILKAVFADKLRECARIVVQRFDGDLDAALDGSVGAAKKALRAFPGIGEPGAEKILTFSGRHAFLAPESNGLRVLVRLGLIAEDDSYAKTYAASRQAAASLPSKPGVMREAHLLLHEHGRTLCRRSAPKCEDCPLARSCAYFVGRPRA
ncbi:MAG TPA: hypothetical protein VFD71_01760 [Planctomycetota bacterium]|nr:hypothetical protein [Planctomycetota bacterium]